MEKLMTTEEMANYLHCSTHHITHLRQVGLIKGMRFGKRWLYACTEVERFVADSNGVDYSNFRNLSPSGLKSLMK